MYLDFFATCYGLNGSQRLRAVGDVLELTELNYKAKSQVAGLSRGMSQRLSIARVLLHDPKVLLLDEPASGLDPRARIEIRELLKELHRMGKTILISSHILHELAELCTSVGIIEQGKLLFSGKVDEILAKAKVGQMIHIEVTERSEDAATLLRGVEGILTVDVVSNNGRHRIDVTLDSNATLERSELPNRLIAQGFRITSMQSEKINLETAFMRLTKGLVG
jgi:ABC-2 type transport system ATP-binding protein